MTTQTLDASPTRDGRIDRTGPPASAPASASPHRPASMAGFALVGPDRTRSHQLGRARSSPSTATAVAGEDLRRRPDRVRSASLLLLPFAAMLDRPVARPGASGDLLAPTARHGRRPSTSLLCLAPGMSAGAAALWLGAPRRRRDPADPDRAQRPAGRSATSSRCCPFAGLPRLRSGPAARDRGGCPAGRRGRRSSSGRRWRPASPCAAHGLTDMVGPCSASPGCVVGLDRPAPAARVGPVDGRGAERRPVRARAARGCRRCPCRPDGAAASSGPTALGATAAAIAAAVVAVATPAWARSRPASPTRFVVAACCAVGALILTSRPAPAGRPGPAGRRRRLGTRLAAGGTAGRAPGRDGPDDADGAAPPRWSRSSSAGLGWLVLAVVLPLVFPDGAVGTGAAGGCGWPSSTSGCSCVDDRCASRRSTTTGVPGTDNPIGLPADLHAGRRRRHRSSSSPSAPPAWSPASSRSPARWRHGSAAGPPAGRLVRPRPRASRWSARPSWPPGCSARRCTRSRSPLCRSPSGSPSSSTGCTRSTCWSTGPCSTRCSPRPSSRVYVLVVGRRRARCSTPAAPAGCRCWPRRWWPSAFQPLREALQGGVNRLTYGAWHEPQALVRSLQLPAARRRPAPDRALRRRPGLGPRRPAPGVAGGHGRRTATSSPRPAAPADAVRALPLVHAGTPVGDPGRRRRLGPAAGRGGPRRAGRRARARRSRRPGCTRTCSAPGSGWCVAREEERRRLRRDLHDGLGPALAGLTLKLDAARNRLGDDAAAARDAERRAVDDRRRPPAGRRAAAGLARRAGPGRGRCGGWSTARRPTARRCGWWPRTPTPPPPPSRWPPTGSCRRR